MATMKVGLVGCGNIASDICLALRDRDIPAEVVALSDSDVSHAEALRDNYKLNACIGTLDELAGAVDYIVECAVAAVVPQVVNAAVRHGVDCLVMSVAALLERPDLPDLARHNNINLWVPSAICGIDGIRAAMHAGLTK